MNLSPSTSIGIKTSVKTTSVFLVTATLLIGTGVGQAADAIGEYTNNTEDKAPLTLQPVSVIGTRTERSLDEVPATVSITTEADIENTLVRDIADLVRFEPGVSVGGTGSRFGLSDFIIRGIGGNRVLVLVDGVRVPDTFSFGPFLSARRDFVDVDSLRQVEIIRGPTSSLYGSDALGGVVAFNTKTPLDYLREKDYYGSLKMGYSSDDDSVVSTATFAAGDERLSGLVIYTRREGNETDNTGRVGGTGPTRERPDRQSVDNDNIIAKVRFSPNEHHTFTASTQYLNNDSDINIFSDYNELTRGTTVNSRDGNDERTRELWSLMYDFRGDLIVADHIKAHVYQQTSKTTQDTDEIRTLPNFATQTRQRSSRFEQELTGAELQFNKSFTLGASTHLLTYGTSYTITDSEELRNGATFDSTGNNVPEFFPFPTRGFPVTEVTQSAFFLQDEVGFFDDALLLSPGIRYDRFDADVNADSIFITGNPGTPTPEDYSDSEVTARIGAVYKVTDKFSVYAHFSEGFRAPPYGDVNVGFSNLIGGYKTVSNTDLKSERSRGLELGLRFNGDDGELHLALYRNKYTDFIDSLVPAPQFLGTGGVDPVDNLLTFQSVNRANVTIKGAELSGKYYLEGLSPSLRGLYVRAAIAYADGEDTDRNEPINDIEPLTGIFGAGYKAAGDRWGADIIWTLVDEKKASDIDQNNPRLATPGYGIVDVMGYINVNQRTRINVGLFNLGDKSYIRWADTRDIEADAVQRFSQPGFNAGASVQVAFW